MRPNPVQTFGIKGKRYPSGVCYAVIPEGVDRDVYIQDCYRRGVIAVQFEDGSNIFNCVVSLSVLQLIDFPKETKQLGSALVYVLEYNHNKPIIIDRIIKDDESTNLSENEFRLEKYTDDGSVYISGRGKEGNLFVNVYGKTNKGGKIFINVSNPTDEGEIVVNLQGNLQMELQDMVVNALKGFGITTKEDININSTEGVVNLGDVKEELEPILLGTKTVNQLSKEVQALTDLLQSIANIIPANVPPSSPDPTWLAWQAAVAAIVDRGNLSGVKSEKTFSE